MHGFMGLFGISVEHRREIGAKALQIALFHDNYTFPFPTLYDTQEGCTVRNLCSTFSLRRTYI